MAIYKADDIVGDVLVVLNQNEEREHLMAIGDEPTLMLDELVRSRIEDAARLVEQKADVRDLDGGRAIKGDIFWNGDGSGYINLPSDFMRLIRFKMSDWARSVTEPITEDMDKYAQQRCRLKAFRGNAEKPVVAIVHSPVGLVLEFYACERENAVITEGMYMPWPKIDDRGGIDLSQRLYKRIVEVTAGLTLMSLGAMDKAQVYLQGVG